MNILFVSSFSPKNTPPSGALSGSKKLFDLLQTFADKTIWEQVNFGKLSGFAKLWRLLSGRVYDVYPEDAKRILNAIVEQRIDVVFFDYAYGGELQKRICLKFPTIIVIKFFHDVNYKKIENEYKNLPVFKIRGACKIKYRSYLKSAIKSERAAVSYCDRFGCLHKRDAKLIEYKYRKKADFYLPVTFAYFDLPPIAQSVYGQGKNLLFVGLMSYAPNIEAVDFFISEVLDSVDATFHIVGSDSESLGEKYEKNKKVRFHGRVADLTQYYLQADAVVAPIFRGGGMKVKICEALAYGKFIFGTKEAFVGYDVDYEQVGGLCENKESFIEKLNDFATRTETLYNPYSRKVFCEKYTNQALLKTVCNLLGGENDHPI